METSPFPPLPSIPSWTTWPTDAATPPANAPPTIAGPERTPPVTAPPKAPPIAPWTAPFASTATNCFPPLVHQFAVVSVTLSHLSLVQSKTSSYQAFVSTKLGGTSLPSMTLKCFNCKYSIVFIFSNKKAYIKEKKHFLHHNSNNHKKPFLHRSLAKI